MRTYLFLLMLTGCLFAAGVLSSCSDKAAGDMADDLCRCMQPVAESYATMEKMAATGDHEGLQQRMAELDSLTTEADGCMNALENKYGEALETSEKAIRAQMTRRCPEVVRVMNTAESERQ